MLIQLGEFSFNVSTAAYSKLVRTTQANWARLPIVGSHEHLHAVGNQNDTIVLIGTVYPQHSVEMGGKGGTTYIDRLRELCEALEPLRIIAADGSTWGYWVIEVLRNQDSYYLSDGTPRKQDFQLRLRFYARHLERPQGVGLAAGRPPAFTPRPTGGLRALSAVGPQVNVEEIQNTQINAYSEFTQANLPDPTSDTFDIEVGALADFDVVEGLEGEGIGTDPEKIGKLEAVVGARHRANASELVEESRANQGDIDLENAKLTENEAEIAELEQQLKEIDENPTENSEQERFSVQATLESVRAKTGGFRQRIQRLEQEKRRLGLLRQQLGIDDIADTLTTFRGATQELNLARAAAFGSIVNTASGEGALNVLVGGRTQSEVVRSAASVEALKSGLTNPF